MSLQSFVRHPKALSVGCVIFAWGENSLPVVDCIVREEAKTFDVKVFYFTKLRPFDPQALVMFTEAMSGFPKLRVANQNSVARGFKMARDVPPNKKWK